MVAQYEQLYATVLSRPRRGASAAFPALNAR
jgi:hypothetical protein